MLTNRKTLIAIIAVILVVLALIFFWSRGRNAPRVKYADATIGEVAASVACSGVIASESADLSSKLGGRISWIGVDVGSRVAAGSVLVKLDTYEQAKRDYDSVSSLYSQGLASKLQLDSAKTVLESASLTSPINGVVVRKTMNVGEVASPGQTIVSVANPAMTWVDMDIDEIDIGEAKEGQEARIYSDAYPDHVFLGRVAWISKAAQLKEGSLTGGDEEERIFKSKVSLENPDGRLRHGMTVDVDVVYEKKKGIVMIPRDAVLFKDSRMYCFLIRGSRVYEREVGIGVRDLVNVEVVKGLKVGDRVAVSNLDKLKNRAIVRIER